MFVSVVRDSIRPVMREHHMHFLLQLAQAEHVQGADVVHGADGAAVVRRSLMEPVVVVMPFVDARQTCT